MEFVNSAFVHEHYNLDDKTGVLSRKAGHTAPRNAEQENLESGSVLEALTTYVQVSNSRIAFVDGSTRQK